MFSNICSGEWFDIDCQSVAEVIISNKETLFKLKTIINTIMNILKRLWCTFLLVAVSVPSFTGFNIEAQSNSKLQKELEKQRTKVYKQLVQEYKKDGWQLANNNTTMEVAVLEHLTKLDDPTHNWSQTTGEVSKCRSMNIGRLSAVNNAQNYLAQLIQGQIEGFVTSEAFADAENMEAEQDIMAAAFSKKIKISLNGALTESYALYKENPDKTIHYKAFYFVDKDKCIAAANSAVEKSLQDSGLALEMAERIRDFVKNSLVIEE